MTPAASHGAGSAFLESFIDCFGLELQDPTSVEIDYLKTFSTSTDDRLEIDLLIETDAGLIGVEIKTTHTESQRKFEKEAAALTEQARDEDKRAVILYLPHLRSEKHSASFTENIATWKEVLAALQTHRGELENPYEIALFDDFSNNLEKHVVGKESTFSTETELYLRFRDQLEKFGIDVPPDSYKIDRKHIYNELWKWFDRTYSVNWDGQFNRKNKFGKRTEYVRLYKNNWHFRDQASGRPPLTLEIQGTEKRLSWHPDHSYRPADPHFEMTVALNDNTDAQHRRRAFAKYLGDSEREALEEAGFSRVSELLEESGSDEAYNKYHMYSKIIELDFDNPNNTVDEMKRGLEAFVALEDAIDEFTKDWAANKITP